MARPRSTRPLPRALAFLIGSVAAVLAHPAHAHCDRWDSLKADQKLSCHAPIYFFHPQEPVLPVAVEDLVDAFALTIRSRGEVCQVARKGEISSMEKLGRRSFWEKRRSILKREARCSRALRERALNQIRRIETALRDGTRIETEIALDFTDLDLEDFRFLDDDPPEPHRRSSPFELGDGFPKPTGPPSCYSHIVEGVRLPESQKTRRKPPRAGRRRAAAKTGGAYDVLYYFLYFPFNVSTNVHEGDWDAAVAIAHPTGLPAGRPVQIVYFSHASSIALDLRPGRDDPMKGFLSDYESWVRAPESSWSEHYVHGIDGSHPLVFVSHGSHAAYPVPGLTLTGVEIDSKIFDLRVPFGFDSHPFGGSYLPTYPVEERSLEQIFAGFDALATTENQPSPWKNLAGDRGACELVRVTRTRPAWTRFPGPWGETSQFSGWAGPGGFMLNSRVVKPGPSQRLADWVRRAVHPLDTVEQGGFGGRLVHLPSTSRLNLGREAPR